MLSKNKVIYNHFDTTIFENFESHWYIKVGCKGSIDMNLINGILTETICELQSVAELRIFSNLKIVLFDKSKQARISDKMKNF